MAVHKKRIANNQFIITLNWQFSIYALPFFIEKHSAFEYVPCRIRYTPPSRSESRTEICSSRIKHSSNATWYLQSTIAFRIRNYCSIFFTEIYLKKLESFTQSEYISNILFYHNLPATTSRWMGQFNCPACGSFGSDKKRQYHCRLHRTVTRLLPP